MSSTILDTQYTPPSGPGATARGGLSGTDDARAARQSAWRREMEKNQLAGWLAHPLLTHAAFVAPSPGAAADAGPRLLFALPPGMRAGAATRLDVAPADDAGSHAAAAAPGHQQAQRSGGAENAAPGGGPAVGSPSGAPVCAAGAPAPQDATAAGSASARAGVDVIGASVIGAAGAAVAPVPPVAALRSLMSQLAPGLGPGGADVHLTVYAGAVAAAPGASVAPAPQPPGAAPAGPPPATYVAQQLAELETAPAETASLEKPVAPEASAPLRMHAEWLSQGVRIWIGADQALRLEGPSLQQLSQQLQQFCRAQGGQLMSLVCNGKIVLDVSMPARPQRRDTALRAGLGAPATPFILSAAPDQEPA